MIFVGVDWAEAHHDICALDEEGATLAKRRIPDTLEGVRQLHALIAEQLGPEGEPAEVVIGIEKDRGLLVAALVAARYHVYAINPFAASRYRERHVTSRAKSDPGDARVLAEIVRTDRHHHREAAGDSTLAGAIKVLARAHQGAIWERQRAANALRNDLKDYYPGALEAFAELTHPDATSVLGVAPTPEAGERLTRTQITAALRRGGRERNLARRTGEIQGALRREQLRLDPALASAYGEATGAHVAMIEGANARIARLEAALAERFSQHPDADVISSLPGLGTVLGARVLGEFGDDPARYADATSRKNYAGTAPITRASGLSRVVLARHARNGRLADALDWWAFCSLTRSPGARDYYDELRARKKTHRQALRQLGNRWVGIYHICVERHELYDESIAWKHRLDLRT